jgi:hypothetical protein
LLFLEEPELLVREEEPDLLLLLRPDVLFDERPRPEEEDERRLPEDWLPEEDDPRSERPRPPSS